MTDRPDPITLAYRLADVAETRLTLALRQRFYGRWTALLIGGSAGLAAGLFWVLALLWLRLDPPSVAVGLVIGGAALLVSSVFARRATRRLQREILAAPFRQAETALTLGPDGIRRPLGGLLPWSMITEVVERPDTTLLLLSPVEFLPLPHDRLPKGIGPQQLRAAIATWRESAGRG